MKTPAAKPQGVSSQFSQEELSPPAACFGYNKPSRASPSVFYLISRRFQNCKTQHNKNGVFLPFYCNSIFCLNCEKRKYKKVFQKYKKIIENRQHTHFYYFLTIAPKRTDGRKLQTAIDKLRHSNKKIRYYTQQLFLGGINRLELSYSPITRTYKPHFHTILETEKQLTENQLKNYLFRIAPKFTTLGTELQTEKNRYGNTSFILSNTEIDLNLQQIKKC